MEKNTISPGMSEKKHHSGRAQHKKHERQEHFVNKNREWTEEKIFELTIF